MFANSAVLSALVGFLALGTSASPAVLEARGDLGGLDMPGYCKKTFGPDWDAIHKDKWDSWLCARTNPLMVKTIDTDALCRWQNDLANAYSVHGEWWDTWRCVVP